MEVRQSDIAFVVSGIINLVVYIWQTAEKYKGTILKISKIIGSGSRKD